MMSGYHVGRQPFAGRSGNTMNVGVHRQPVPKREVDSVRSLNDIALRDAEELQIMMERQSQRHMQPSFTPLDNRATCPPNHGRYVNSHGSRKPVNPIRARMPTQLSYPPPADYCVGENKNQEQMNYYANHENSFSLHTAPLAATFNHGANYMKPSADLYATPNGESDLELHHNFGVFPAPGTVGPFARCPSRPETLQRPGTSFEDAALDRCAPIQLPQQEFPKNHRLNARAMAVAPDPGLPPSPGEELCDYARMLAPKIPMPSRSALPVVPPSGPSSSKEEDITISFKPKVDLVKGNTVSQVRLVLADFEGADADYIKLDSVPHRAFIGAYWTSKTKELALILGDDVSAQTSVSIMIPASSGIRRALKKEQMKEPAAAEQISEQGPTRNIAAIVKAAENSMPLPPACKVEPATESSNELEQDERDQTKQICTNANNHAAERAIDNKTDSSSSIVAEEPNMEGEKRQYGIDCQLTWSETEQAFTVSEIIRGGAAWKNGLINIGNTVTHIDEELLEGKSEEDVRQCLLGQPLTAVVLTIRDHVDPLSGQIQTRDVKVMRYDLLEMTMDFYDEEEFCDIPEVEEEQTEVISQAEWARRQLAQGPKEVTKMVDLNDISKKVSDQSKAAKEKLQTRSCITKTEYDAESVAQQARWAKEQLDNRQDTTQKTMFDAEMVAEQTRSAMQSLANLPQKEVEKKFDAQAVADQAKWAKQQLENRTGNTTSTEIDAASVSEQAQWARRRLLEKEQGLNEESFHQEEVENNDPNSQTMPASGDALDELCKLAGLDDLPGMDEVLANKSPVVQAPVQNASQGAESHMREDLPVLAPPSNPGPAPAVMSAAEDEEVQAEKKRRAMQKRLEFLAKAAENKSTNESIDGLLSCAPPQQQAASNNVPQMEIILAPSPVEGESTGTSPTATQMATFPMDQASLFTVPPAHIVEQQQKVEEGAQQKPVLKPRTSSLAGRPSDVDLNSSALPPPTKNFIDTSQRESLASAREINVEEEMQFLDALAQSTGTA